MSVRLIEVTLLGASDDRELLNRLADDLLRFDIRASTNPLSEERPAKIGSSVTSPAVLLWTRSAVESRWLVSEVDGARRSGPVIVGRADDVEPPSYARDLPVVELMPWRADGNALALEPLTDLIREIASRTLDPGTSEASVDAPMTKESPALWERAPTLGDDSSEVDLSRLRPGALELLVLADRIAGRRGVLAGPVDVVLAATVRPVLTGLDAEQLTAGAAYSLYAAVPDVRDERLNAALSAIGAGSLASMITEGVPDRGEAPPAVRRSPNLAQLVVQATQLVTDLSANVTAKSVRDPEVFSHHLVGVVLARAELPPNVARALGVGDDGLRAALLSAVRERYPEEDSSQWTALLVRPLGEAVASFHHDDTRHRDLLAEDSLDIEPHVRALALLMSSKVLKPPLAVGLFGDWGSGKTYFMRALRQEVDRVTREARDSRLPQRQLPVYRNVAQIEFNAWHFVDTDLWASLADYIFANLRITERERPEDVERRRGLYVAQLRKQGAAIRQVETERQHLQAKIELSEAELQQLRSQKQHQLDFAQQARAAVSVSPELKTSVDVVTEQLGIPRVGDSLAEFEAALARARAVTTSARSRGAVLIGRYGARWAVPAVAALLLGPLVLMLTLYIPGFDGIKSAATTVAGFIVGAAAWLNVATSAVNHTLKRINEIDVALAMEVEADPEVADRRTALEALGEEEKQLGEQAVKLREQLVEVEQALRKLSPAQLLADFILSRNDSDDYRKHLGLASLIRKDFEALAEHIDAFNLSLESDETPPEPPQAPADASEADPQQASEGSAVLDPPSESDYHVNRIVLYIDDLDRCPPETVAKVLQAVHLLLAFPLFVVVMGVDARWLSRSLTKHYEGLLASGERNEEHESASPQDYLEKIFQIPFWLRPMPLDATGRLLTALTQMDPSSKSDAPGESGIDQTRRTTAAEDPGQTGSTSQYELDTATRGKDTPTTPTPDLARKTGSRGSGTEGDGTRGGDGQPAYSLRLSSVEVTQDERNFMQELRPMLGRSPRSLTRYVNIFRLLKAVDLHDSAAKDGGDLSTKDADHTTMFLLSVLTSLPDVAQALLPALARSRTEGEDEALVTVVQRLRGSSSSDSSSSGPAADEEQWDRLQEWLDEHQEWAAEQRVGAWDRKAQRVARYSYRFDALSARQRHERVASDAESRQ